MKPPEDRASLPADPVDLAAVVVTYGQRWRHLSQVLISLDKDPDVGHVVVVVNGPSDVTSPRVDGSLPATPHTAVRLDRNRGSAGGFAVGLDVATCLVESDGLILMLDDDNRPQPDAIAALLLRASGNPDADGFLMNRYTRADIARAVRYGRTLREARNTFASFSVGRALRKRALRFRRVDAHRDQAVRAEVAPYGGLAMRRSTIERIGLPREDYFLYSDDHEYSYRITASAGFVELVEDAVLDDLELSWHQQRSTLLPWMDPDAPELRVYYTVRNRVHFERKDLCTSPPLRRLNQAVFATMIAVDALTLLLHGVDGRSIGQRLRLIREATRDGEQAQLAQRSFDARTDDQLHWNAI